MRLFGTKMPWPIMLTAFATVRPLVCATRVGRNEYEIFKDITRNYDKQVRPVHDSSQAVFVLVDMASFYLISMQWYDEILKWNGTEMDNIESIRIPESIVWKPDIILSESYATDRLMPDEQRSVEVFRNGLVKFDAALLVTNICYLAVDDFPFDVQSCDVVLEPWAYPKSQLSVRANMSRNFTEGGLMGNGEWELLSIVPTEYDYEDDGTIFSAASYAVKLKRRSTYYVCVLILPTFIIATLCLVGLFAPTSNSGERDEKVSMGLSTLLSMAVILGIVAGEMPKTTTLPLLGYYVLAEIITCTVGVGVSVFISFCHQRMATRRVEPPSWLISFTWLSPCVFTASKPKEKLAKEVLEKPVNDPAIISTEKKMLQEYFAEKRAEQAIIDQWIIIFDRVDLALLFAFQFVNIVGSAWLLYPFN